MSLIVTALLTWVGTSLHATTNFQDERNVEYAATDAVNLAIQNTRYSFDYGTVIEPLSPSGPMLNNRHTAALLDLPSARPGKPVDVYCSLVWQPYSANTRVFTYSACSTPAPTTRTAAADCAAQPLLQAVVAFDDYPSRGRFALADPEPMHADPCNRGTPSGPENGSCGVSMTQLSWQWNPVVPAITSLSPSSGSTSGGTTVTIQGTGFTSGETVNFLQQPQECTGTPTTRPWQRRSPPHPAALFPHASK